MGTGSSFIDRQLRRAAVDRSQLVRAMTDYYGTNSAPHHLYEASLGGEPIATTILTRSDWLDLACPLTSDRDRFTVDGRDQATTNALRGATGRRALDRLAEAALLGVRITNKPLYRLLDVDIRTRVISGSVGLAPFVEYALTMDLLEGELADAVVRGGHRPSAASRSLPAGPGFSPRPRGRLCAGGVLGLCAIARPADVYRGPADYALLVQERSSQVLNAAGRLAVIPKGFHEPLSDPRADARISATLRREMEEELFGRVEVDSTAGTAASRHRCTRAGYPSRCGG